jgi:hypothetical protein
MEVLMPLMGLVVLLGVGFPTITCRVWKGSAFGFREAVVVVSYLGLMVEIILFMCFIYSRR